MSKDTTTPPIRKNGKNSTASGSLEQRNRTIRYRSIQAETPTEQTAKHLAALHPKGTVFELRVLVKSGRWTKTFVGYFDDPDIASAELHRHQSKEVKGSYVTLNPVDPSLLARTGGQKLQEAGSDDATKDSDIAERRWLLLDFDAVRKAGISASDNEHDTALALADGVRGELAKELWPEPIALDSGNGAHLLYRIDLPNTAESTELVKGVLAALAERFDTPAVKLDTTVFNPSRITKLAGTAARKGSNVPDRPHRLARFISRPAKLRAIPTAKLEKFRPVVERKTAPVATGNFDVAAMLDRYRDEYGIREPVPFKGTGRKWAFAKCPGCGKARFAVMEWPDGTLGAKCPHTSCELQTDGAWKRLRAKLDPHPVKPSEAVRTSLKERTKTRTLTSLLKEKMEPTRIIVERLLPEGLAILAGPSKFGKSILALNLALGVAQGKPVLGSPEKRVDGFTCERGDVLYLALEDSAIRLQTRARQMLGRDKAKVDSMHWALEWPRGEESLAGIELWLTEHPAARLVVIDVLELLRPIQATNGEPYRDEYRFLQPLAALAKKFRVAIVAIHHTRKASGNPLDKVAGTIATVGAADTVLVFEYGNDKTEGVLHVKGRDIAEETMLLEHASDSLGWTVNAFDYDQDRRMASENKDAVLQMLRESGKALTPKAIRAELVGVSAPSLSRTLARLAGSGKVARVAGGAYQSIQGKRE